MGWRQGRSLFGEVLLASMAHHEKGNFPAKLIWYPIVPSKVSFFHVADL